MDLDARELAASFDLERLTPAFYADPYPTYRALRETDPVKRMPDGSYFLTRYDDLVPAYKNTKAFSSDKKKEFSPKYGASLLYEHHTTSLVFNDPPAHTRVRRLIMGALSPRAIAGDGAGPDRSWSTRLLDAMAAKGRRRQGRPDRGFRRRDPDRGHRQPARCAARTSAGRCAHGRSRSSARSSRCSAPGASRAATTRSPRCSAISKGWCARRRANPGDPDTTC